MEHFKGSGPDSRSVAIIGGGVAGPDSRSVAIIGGGVAGLAAAQLLGQHHVRVHLVEKSERTGGNAAKWSCMATGTCQNCGACLGADLAQSVSDMASVRVYLNTQISSFEKIGEKYRIGLDQSPEIFLDVEKVILATGFTPFVPDGLLGDAWSRHRNVITTDQLNSILKAQTLFEYFKETPAPEIAFIQCVGSRNREKNRDYCSQVCCKISLRHINKLLHLYPEAKITLFYMDLQVIGKEMRAAFNALSKNVRLIQGVPGEILDHKIKDKLTLIHEHPDAMARVADHFDMIVLSVGIHPPENMSGTLGLLDIRPDDWGFVPLRPDDPMQDILVAGCAAGPKDILASQQQGRNCACRILQTFNSASGKRPGGVVAVIGDGDEADQAAQALSETGYTPWILGRNPSAKPSAAGINTVPECDILSINGTAGHFTIRYRTKNKTYALETHAIVMAKPAVYDTAKPESCLTSDRVFSLEAFSKRVAEQPDTLPEHMVFWLDYSGPEPKASAGTVLTLARDMAAQKKKVTVLMQKMLVHGMDGQRLYDESRKQGVIFLRVAAPSDVQVTPSSEGIEYTIKETSLKDVTLSLKSDWLIIPSKKSPDPSFELISGLLREQTDGEGYLQSPNVRHRLTDSFRKGLFYAGSCHDDIDAHDLKQEIANICSAINDLKAIEIPPEDERVIINEKKCAKCLTCYRVCPHVAIRIKDGFKPVIVPEACFSCGLCMANCPALAIERTRQADEDLTGTIEKGQKVVFACRRSAALAAAENAWDASVNVIPVPCACRISLSLVLKALLKGADKIILAGCHEDNCRSDRGSHEAKGIVEYINHLPVGHREKIIWAPIAANEPEKFKQLIVQS